MHKLIVEAAREWHRPGHRRHSGAEGLLAMVSLLTKDVIYHHIANIFNRCFWINLPLCGLALLIVAFVLPFKKVRGDFKQCAPCLVPSG